MLLSVFDYLLLVLYYRTVHRVTVLHTYINNKMLVQIVLLVALGVLFYWYGTRKFNYWKKRGVKHRKPVFLMGTSLELYTAKKSATQLVQDDYNLFPNEKVVGMCSPVGPELIIRDPSIIQQILCTDFQYFYPRGFLHDRTVIEPLMQNLFFADGDLWRLLRQRFTPAFTTGKLRAMFPLIVERAEHLQARLSKAVESGIPLDARDLMARFTTDFIGACGFGLQADTLNEEDSAFRKLGYNIFNITPIQFARMLAKEIMPSTFKYVKLLGHIEKDVINLVKQILSQRDYKPSGRNDFIDLLLEYRKKGNMTGESFEKDSNGQPKIISAELTDELLAAQVFVFFAAGFETSSSSTSYTLHQLAYHPKIQLKVQEEIDRVLAEHDNKLSYDAIKDMTYLDWTFREGLRMFPSLGFLRRECAKKYTIPQLNMEIDEGVGIYIPVQALHHDPQYFENPKEFNPERFSPERFTEKCKKVYLPFGSGPRACIGERLGLMQSLAGLAAILSKFSVEPAPQSLRHPTVDPKSNIVQSVLNGLPLNFRERKVHK